MNSLARVLDGLVERIEGMSALDRPAEVVASVVRRVIPDGPVRDLASGTPAGHPLHPALVAVPMGAWLSAGYLDFATDNDDAARRLIGLGLLGALPAAATGGSDWLDTDGRERRVGFVHAVLNWTAIGLYGTSWLLRRRDRHGAGAGFALAGAGTLGAAGWLGGHLAYALGVGVDTTAFLALVPDWTDAASADDLPLGLPVRATAEGVAVFLLRTDTGVVALADRCTHRGAPLDEGTLEGDCIVCPWHGSKFDVHDGSVKRGPATRPQPVYEVREVDGRIQVRYSQEQPSLRTNPVGA